MNDWRRTCWTTALLLAGGTTWGEELPVDVLTQAPIPLTQPLPQQFLIDDTNVSGILNLVNDNHAGRAVLLVDASEEPAGKYYIGLACDESLPDALRTQLGLTEEQGLLVTDTVESSPARAAGFQKHDIVLEAKFGDKSFGVNSVRGLVGVVQEAETKPITFDVLRQGKRISVTVTPAERPQPIKVVVETTKSDPNQPAHAARVQQLMQELQQALAAQQGQFVFGLAGPVVTQTTANELPENMSVTITKTGKEDARITVKKGSDSWGATEKEIDTLPAEVQGYVRRLLSGISAPPGDIVSDWPVPFRYRSIPSRTLPPAVPHVVHTAPAISTPYPVGSPAGIRFTQPAVRDPFAAHAESLKALREQLQALQKDVQALRESLEKK